MKLKLLVSPLARSAYFADTLDLALAELEALLPGLGPQVERVGGLDFVAVQALPEQLPLLARASFVQGMFRQDVAGWTPLEQTSDFVLPDDWVFGDKYRGKTNETVTQLAINLALGFCQAPGGARSLLDPMAGRGTTLLWALRFGLDARGIEQDGKALDALQRQVKKQSKLHRLKHRLSGGFVGQRNRGGRGKFVRVEVLGHTLQLITGDSRHASELLGGQRFDTLVTDLPYGVQHRGDKRNPLDTVRQCAPGWVDSVRTGGALVLIFNTYQPRRDVLLELFTGLGCRHEPFEAPHRMSESIVRDLLVFTRPNPTPPTPAQ